MKTDRGAREESILSLFEGQVSKTCITVTDVD